MWSRPEWRLFAAALLLCASFSPAFAARAIVNSQLPDAEIADRTDLRAVFTLRKRQWNDGQPIKVYVLSDRNPVHEDFVKGKLHLFPYQLRQIWNRLVFSGTGVAPVQLDSETEILEAVAEDPYAIGYVNGVELTEAVKEVPRSSPEQPAEAPDEEALP